MDRAVTTGTLAELFGVSDRTIRGLAKRAIVIRAKRGFDLRKSVRNYCDHLRKLATGRGGDVAERNAPIAVAPPSAIKIISEEERIITATIGDAAGKPSNFVCQAALVPKGAIDCRERIGAGEPWLFYGSSYVRAFLAGRPAGGGDPNILVAYGTCAQF